jgi:two-component system phosphate regulon sensor histidine kinase PhoR
MDKPLSDVARDHELDLIVRHAMEAREGVTEQIVLAPGGVVAEVRVMPVDSEGRQLGAVVIIRDITELQRLGRVRRDFIANISHELRSPLTSIKLLIDTLRNGALSRPRIAAEMISRIDQEVDALVELVEELLELSRIESGRSTFLLAATDLEPAIRTVVDRLAPQAQRKGVGVDLDLSGLSPALADSDRFARAFMNLLHNAIKFTPDGGHITITGRTITIPGPTARAIDADRVTIPSSGRPSLEPGTWVIVSVADTGIGIPREDLPRIFERFYKVDRARQRGDRGTGLGLAIARHIVEGHGGAIWAESIEGRGSTFYVALRGDEGGKAHA